MQNIKPINKEQKVNTMLICTTSTDKHGIIYTASEEFVQLSGYERNELIDANHNIVRHPDMPKIIFKIMWEKLKKNETFVGFIMNMTKNGEYYWLKDEIKVMRKNDNGIRLYYSSKSFASRRAVKRFGSLYAALLKKEKEEGYDASEAYLIDFLNFRGVSYDEYVATFLEAGGPLLTGYYMTRKLLT